ncbi:hira protein [Schizosaccharomyces japonicus yFS275]|uniref:Protein HIR n=1 Tax=Schizosaccharomyces japonicus (strain yFS275 / FY16936) TaxID=402676 RepID=B6JWY8_SCHJY|nr:hira protein [Schizosaccharomyces japonicus yFS275]EEB05889.1 hira protein [Schizosaccharomyces japonicus yFS275]
MKLLKPSWLGHFDDRGHRLSVFSIHVHPDGSRIVTGGLDGTVRIWSTKALYEEDKGLPKQLCCMSTHTGTVTSVRFSPNGQFLASGSDDRVVIVWHKDDSVPGLRTIFGSTETNSENWRSFRRLTGHDNDIQDLCWSHDSQLLVSVGLDSSIIVWNGNTFERLKRIEAHQSHVKGITFDPAGKYFATESDDRTIKVWRTTDFALEKTIIQPFNNSPLSTYFRRPSWSPDGKYIAAPNAMNGPVSCVAIIERGTWTSDVNIIGHEGAVEVTSFNPKLLKGPNDKLVSLLACGGQDRALSLWTTASPRPIIVCEELAQKSIGDLCWTSDGLNLFACSYDGYVILCIFEPSELGEIVSDEEVTKALAKFGHGRHGIVLPESCSQLALEAKIEENEVKTTKVPSIATHTTIPATLNVSTPSVASTTLAAPSTPVIEGPPTQKTGTPTAPPSEPPKFKQKVTITKDGKKRVTPQLLTTLPSVPSAKLPSSQQMSQSASTQLPVLELSQPTHTLPKGGMTVMAVGTKRRAVTESSEAPVEEQPVQKSPEEALAPYVLPNVIDPKVSIVTTLLDVPKLDDAISCYLKGNTRYSLEVQNGSSERHPTRIVAFENGNLKWMDYIPRPVLLTASSSRFWAIACDDASLHVYSIIGTRILPPIVVDSNACFLMCSENCLLCITANGMIHAYDIINKKALFTPISLAPILNGSTTTDTKSADELSRIVSTSITEQGAPVIALSSGESYLYSLEMLCWTRISDSWWALGSKLWDSSGISLSPEALPDYSIRRLENHTNESVVKIGRGRLLQKMMKTATADEGYEDFETTITINHVENRLCSALLLHSSQEYSDAALQYVDLLSENRLWGKLSEFLHSLCADKQTPIITTLMNQKLWRKILDKIYTLVPVSEVPEEISRFEAKFVERYAANE